MISLRVELPRSSELRILRAIDPSVVRWAEREALNGTASAAQKLALKEVADEMGIPVSKLKKRGRQIQQRSQTGKMGALPVRKATRRDLRAILQGYGRPFNLSRFKAQEITSGSRTTRKGRFVRGKGRVVGVVHEAWGRRQVALGMFRLGKGNRGPVIVPEGGKLRGGYGPGVTHVLMYPDILRRLRAKVATEFPDRFAKRLMYAVSSRSHLR